MTSSRSLHRRPAPDPTPGARAPWRAVAVPTEHGGWGLTLEPVVLGLLVAPSAAGVLIGLAAFTAFVARTPLKLVLVDRHRRRHLDRTALASRVLAIESAALVLLLVGAAIVTRHPFWIPLAVALPLIALELWFDMRSRSRRLLPELAGTIGIGSVAAAIALAGGTGAATAAGLWIVIGARALASIPFVRLQLQRAKTAGGRRWPSDLYGLGALVMVVGAVAAGWLPVAAAIAIGLLGVVQAVLARRPPPRAAIVGAQQMVLGLSVVVITALGVLAP